jgi:hypothetical protein
MTSSSGRTIVIGEVTVIAFKNVNKLILNGEDGN